MIFDIKIPTYLDLIIGILSLSKESPIKNHNNKKSYLAKKKEIMSHL